MVSGHVLFPGVANVSPNDSGPRPTDGRTLGLSKSAEKERQTQQRSFLTIDSSGGGGGGSGSTLLLGEGRG